ncbi:hypothetical protein [Erythrobacter rubeus]|uniref:Sugar transporter n=1 Tax=Erythrobacter rubeus TaxID=2760803 RepID=A0ABR8KS94_9SPHN|nr:hypothetical protein [Erythrobacter rubeus]MBD2842445.1 hypothetical protein [Erythrobacter rubeus]
MNRLGEAKTPWHLWVIGVVSLLWNAVGAASYTMTELGMLDGMGMPSEQLDYFYSFPAWAVAFWALGVWGCLFGSLALLFRSKWAVWLFGISIIGLLGTTYYQRAVADMPPSLATTGQDIFAAVIWIITIGLFFYASRMKRAGVLR